MANLFYGTCQKIKVLSKLSLSGPFAKMSEKSLISTKSKMTTRVANRPLLERTTLYLTLSVLVLYEVQKCPLF